MREIELPGSTMEMCRKEWHQSKSAIVSLSRADCLALAEFFGSVVSAESFPMRILFPDGKLRPNYGAELGYEMRFLHGAEFGAAALIDGGIEIRTNQVDMRTLGEDLVSLAEGVFFEIDFCDQIVHEGVTAISFQADFDEGNPPNEIGGNRTV